MAELLAGAAGAAEELLAGAAGEEALAAEGQRHSGFRSDEPLRAPGDARGARGGCQLASSALLLELLWAAPLLNRLYSMLGISQVATADVFWWGKCRRVPTSRGARRGKPLPQGDLQREKPPADLDQPTTLAFAMILGAGAAGKASTFLKCEVTVKASDTAHRRASPVRGTQRKTLGYTLVYSMRTVTILMLDGVTQPSFHPLRVCARALEEGSTTTTGGGHVSRQ